MNALHYVMSHLKAAQMKGDERGVTAIEYALIAALIGIVIIVGAHNARHDDKRQVQHDRCVNHRRGHEVESEIPAGCGRGSCATSAA